MRNGMLRQYLPINFNSIHLNSIQFNSIHF
nr:MAG TPA: hypothetical protein [Caudoviricetes sp.]